MGNQAWRNDGVIMNAHLIEFILLTASVWVAASGERLFKHIYAKTKNVLAKDMIETDLCLIYV